MTPTRHDGPTARRRPGVSPLVALLALGIFLVPGVGDLLEYDRDAILGAGQVWRLLTCQLTHCSLEHLAWDAVTLVVLGLACETLWQDRMRVCLLLGMIVVPVGILLLAPGLQYYRGLSAIDAALFTLLAGGLLREGRSGCGVILTLALAAFLGKVTYELVTGSCIFVDAGTSGFQPVPLAHLLGGGLGLVVGLVRTHGDPRRGTSQCVHVGAPV